MLQDESGKVLAKPCKMGLKLKISKHKLKSMNTRNVAIYAKRLA